MVAGTRDGMRTAINKKARETKAEVVDFMKTYLEDAEALDGLEFLSMAEAGEMAHWEILAKLNETAEGSGCGRRLSIRRAAAARPCRRRSRALAAAGRRRGPLRSGLAASRLLEYGHQSHSDSGLA